MKMNWKEDVRRFVIVCLAAVIMALNIKTFVRTGGLFPGGATGLTILIQRSARMFFHIEVPYTLVNVILNAIPVYIGFRYIGKKFTGYSCLMILLSGILTDLLPGYSITSDTLLISIFGGIINGSVMSLCLFGNATTGGTDFIAIFLSERKGMDAWNLVLGLNVLILAVAGLLFGWDKALYSILFQFASTQVIKLLDPSGRRATLFIVTRRETAQAVWQQIRDTHHSATLFQGTGLYDGEERVMLYSVVGGNQVRALIHRVRQTDPHAFVNVMRTDQVAGRFYRAPRD